MSGKIGVAGLKPAHKALHEALTLRLYVSVCQAMVLQRESCPRQTEFQNYICR